MMMGHLDAARRHERGYEIGDEAHGGHGDERAEMSTATGFQKRQSPTARRQADARSAATLIKLCWRARSRSGAGPCVFLLIVSTQLPHDGGFGSLALWKQIKTNYASDFSKRHKRERDTVDCNARSSSSRPRSSPGLLWRQSAARKHRQAFAQVDLRKPARAHKKLPQKVVHDAGFRFQSTDMKIQ